MKQKGPKGIIPSFSHDHTVKRPARQMNFVMTKRFQKSPNRYKERKDNNSFNPMSSKLNDTFQAPSLTDRIMMQVDNPPALDLKSTSTDIGGANFFSLKV